jgi:hypothetical protein
MLHDQTVRRIHEIRCPGHLGSRRCGKFLVRIVVHPALRLSHQIDHQVRCERCRQQYTIVITGPDRPALYQID